MDYAHLDAAQRRAMLDARLAQYEAEHFAHSVNVDLLTASGDTSAGVQAAIAAERDAMATLDRAHAYCAQMRDALAPPD